MINRWLQGAPHLRSDIEKDTAIACEARNLLIGRHIGNSGG